MLLTRDKSQLLIVDVQDRLLDAMSAKSRLVQRCVRLVQAAKALDIPITVSEQYPQGLGATIESIRWALPNSASIMSKVEFSCVKNEPLRDRLHELRRQGRQQVVIAGIEAHVCVMQTAIDLENYGFDAFVVADAVSSRSKTSKRLALARLAQAGADIVDSEMVLFEWLGRAGTPEFKELQALVK
ncbi:MAG: hydrolase [Methyloceanibacter sp.]|nr:hydrolase [Methyloceanibacter sp.]